jgi:chorismate synthase
MLRWLTAGESHGQALTGIIEGLPQGIPVVREDFELLMRKRWAGFGRGGRKKLESDVVEVLSGIRFSQTLGTPLSLLIRNAEAEKWAHILSPWGPPNETGKVTVPRPGHADLAGTQKYGFSDIRNVMERASARETAMRTALSVPLRNLLRQVGVTSVAFVREIGGIPVRTIPKSPHLWPQAVAANGEAFLSPCSEVITEWQKAITAAAAAGETLGGIFEICFLGLLPGWGSHVHWDKRLDTRLGAAILSIPGVKACEIGDGIQCAGQPGSMTADLIRVATAGQTSRETNRSGGLEGGMTTGMPLIIRGWMKPIPSRPGVESVDIMTGKAAVTAGERADVCAVPAAALAAESVVAFELARAIMEKHGGDTLAQIQHSLAHYQESLR